MISGFFFFYILPLTVEMQSNNTAAIRSDAEVMKTTVLHMEQGLSSCPDDVTLLLLKVGKHETEVGNLGEKCLDMKARIRRSNILIINVPKILGSNTPIDVSKLLREALKMDKDFLVDWSQRGLQRRSQDGKPQIIVAKVHYDQDCVDILRHARESGPLRFKGIVISIFPDYPLSVVQARSAFSEVRQLLCGRDGVKYSLLYPAQLKITSNGTEKWLQNPGETMAYMNTTILLDSPRD